MTNKTTEKRQVWAVVYVGAPYGEGEFGEVVSRHRTEEAARAALAKLRDNPRYYGSNAAVKEVV